MYAQQKNYSKLSLGSSTNAISSMIWGSQWDQIMIWMKDVKNTKYTKATSTTYYVLNAIGMGNYGVDATGTTKSTKAIEATGNSEDYKVKNIYDLAGNVYDWTLEANVTNLRVMRGGYYNNTNTSYTRAGDRDYDFPYYSISNFGSRVSLY
jgi:hypothetical protein